MVTSSGRKEELQPTCKSREADSTGYSVIVTIADLLVVYLSSQICIFVCIKIYGCVNVSVDVLIVFTLCKYVFISFYACSQETLNKISN